MHWTFAIFLGFAAPAAASCPAATHVADVETRLDAAESAYKGLDSSGFTTALDEITFLLPCLSDAVKPMLAARYHRTIGLRLYGDGDEAGAMRAFRAARRADPDFAFTDDLVPSGHPVRTQYTQVDTGAVSIGKVPEPKSGGIAVDGERTRQRARETPAVVQVFDGTGRVLVTSYVEPGGALPEYKAIPRVRNRLLIGTGVALALAAGLDAMGFVTKGQFERFEPGPDPKKNNEELAAFPNRIRTYNYLAGGTLIIAVGTGSAALLVGER